MNNDYIHRKCVETADSSAVNIDTRDLPETYPKLKKAASATGLYSGRQEDADAIYQLTSLCCNLQTKTPSSDGSLQTYYYLHLRMADYKLCSARPLTRV